MNFIPIYIYGTDLDDTWFQLLWYLKESGRKYYIDEGSYAGQHRLAFDFVSGAIRFPHKRPLAPQIPESSPLPPPTTDEEIEQYFANYLMNSELEKNEDYRYATWIVGGKYEVPFAGKRIIPNMAEWLINHFCEKGWGNEHGYINIGCPESNYAYDIPYKDESGRRTSPCLRGLDFRIINGILTTHVIYRSWDLVGGWPTNMGGFTLLNEYIAQEVGAEPGPLTFSCKSLHAYSFHLDYLNQRVGV